MLKLLYIADRECLKETGKPLTGGSHVVMDNGPLHSRVYNMVKGSDPDSSAWQKHIQKSGYVISLHDDPGVDCLTRFEDEKLCEVVERYKDTDDWALVNKTHELPEVKKNKPPEGSRNIIPLEDILTAVGLADKADKIFEEATTAARISRGLRIGG